jgi:ABC-type Fe3+-citrate transport system substrate-binding protein
MVVDYSDKQTWWSIAAIKNMAVDYSDKQTWRSITALNKHGDRLQR